MNTPVPAAASVPSAWEARSYGAGLWLALAVPLIAYVATASGHSYWLDAGEFVAASADLDIAHPPGHPLAALWGKLFTLLPLGPLSFRVALGQALAAAIASGFVYLAGCAAARAMGLLRAPLVTAVGLCAAWLWAFSFSVWFQAVRPEVYALQGLLLVVSLERMTAVQCSAGRDPRALYAASLALGLGLTNHHVMAAFMLPSLLFTLVTVSRRHGVRVWLRSAAFGLLGLLVYVYLPLRAARQPPMNLGDPTSPERLFWVVSAQVYTRFMGGREPQPFGDRALDVVVSVATDLHPLFVLLAGFGLYAGLRLRPSRGIAALYAITALTVLGVRPWLGAVRGNPDALGYMIAGIAALALLAGCGLALCAALLPERRTGQTAAGALLGLAALAALGLGWSRSDPPADLADFHAVDRFDDVRVRGLPPRAVVVAGTPQTVFRHFELRSSEALRPDTALVPLPFLRYPGVAASIVRAHPDLRPLVESYLASDRLSLPALTQLAARRPLLVEMEPHVAPAAYTALVPAALLYAVVKPELAAQLMPYAAALRDRIHARIGRDVASSAREPETARQQLWLHYMDALFHAARGERTLADAALRAADQLAPGDLYLAGLRAALANGDGPLDVRPFMQLQAP